MRSLTLGLALGSALALAATPAHADEKCTGEVQAAFAKQGGVPKMRTVMTHTATGEGGTVTRTVSLVRPNRLHMVTEAANQEAGRLETISIGQWAWGAESDGSWTEHKPNVAKMIELDVAKMAGPQQVGNNFSCLGKAAYEGRDYTAYRADPGKGDDGVELAATIYVDPASGLPAYNVVAPTSGDATARLKQAYSYGDDITVDPPAGFAVPAAKTDGAAEAPQRN
jgi:hypothetical protein